MGGEAAAGEMNKATEGILRALGVGEEIGDSVHTILRASGPDGSVAPKLMPIPAVLGSLNSVADLSNRTAIPRGIYSFSANRFNELMSTFVDMAGGDTGKDFLRNVLGVSPKVHGGTASALVGRYAGRVAAAGALYMGVEQADWIRRSGPAGEIVASGAVSGLVAYSLQKMGHNRLAATAGIASFF